VSLWYDYVRESNSSKSPFGGFDHVLWGGKGIHSRRSAQKKPDLSEHKKEKKGENLVWRDRRGGRGRGKSRNRNKATHN